MSAPDAGAYQEPPTEPDHEDVDLVDILRSKLLDTGGLDTIPEPEPLVTGAIYRDSLVWLQGKRGNGKSFVALDIAGCVGTGEHWQGRKVSQGPVLYIAAEGVSGMRWRVRAWEKSMGLPMTGVKWLPVPVMANSISQWAALVELSKEITPALIVVDTQARVTTGMEENAAKDMGEFVHALEQLRRASGACVMVVHHMGRNGDHMRGSTALEGAASTIVQVAKEDELLTISCPKQKDAEEFEEFTLKLVVTGDSAVLMQTDGRSRAGATAAAMKMAKAWWDVFGTDRVSISKLAKAEVAGERTLYRHIGTLVNEGIVQKLESGANTYYKILWDPAPGGEE